MAKIADSIESAQADNVESYSTETPASEAPQAQRPVLTVPGAAVGRRKEAIARARLVPGSGTITVNGREFADYFPNKLHQQLITDPFKVLDLIGGYDVVARITGGGPSGQAGACVWRSLVRSTRSTARTTVPSSRRQASSLVTLASSSARRPVSRRPARRRSSPSAKRRKRLGSGSCLAFSEPTESADSRTVRSPPTSRSVLPSQLLLY